MTILLLAIFTFLMPLAVFPQHKQAAFPVSDASSLRQFIQAAMQYPDFEFNNNIQGRVKVLFIVHPEGNSSDFRIEKSLSPGLDAEAIRIIRKIQWNPAVSNGVKIKSQQEYTIQFRKSQYLKAIRSRGYEHIAPPRLPTDDSNKIYSLNLLDEAPSPKIQGGFNSLSRYIAEQMKYPEAARNAAIEGTVKLTFVVEEDGIASNITIEQSVGGGCDQEAIRILQSLLWNPGEKGGLAVRTSSTLDITFRLSDRKQQSIPNRNNTGL